jgi:hypothetical protein
MLKRLSLLSTLSVLLLAAPAFASFHLMQIEQVNGGVGGNTNQQAIQLRMRAAGQNFVSAARIRAWDATGMNPILIIDMMTDVPNGNLGDRVVIVSSAYAAAHPSPTPDFIMTNTIPASYLAAGRLTFEFDGGLIYWSLAWGGAGYTGSNAGEPDNDPNSNFGPPFGSALPSATNQGLRFTGTASAQSNSNLADYAVTAGAAVYTNNAGVSAPVPVELMEFRIE